MLRAKLQAGLDFLTAQIIAEIKAQGHVATGKLINSLETVIEQKGTLLVGKILINDYSGILNAGVSPERVPYTPRSGRKTSKYITALINWGRVVKPSLSEKELKSFAFAVAATAKKEGHPTRGSYAYSENGRRKSWAENSIDNNIDRFTEILDLELALVADIESVLNKFSQVR